MSHMDNFSFTLYFCIQEKWIRFFKIIFLMHVNEHFEGRNIKNFRDKLSHLNILNNNNNKNPATLNYFFFFHLKLLV